MSLLIGQSGSLLRDDYVQPANPFASRSLQSVGDVTSGFTGSRSTGLIAKGAYLQPGPYASLSQEDPSRFRNTAYVAPSQIELMQGFMDTPFQNANPMQSDTRVMPMSTFLDQAPPSMQLRQQLSSQSAGSLSRGSGSNYGAQAKQMQQYQLRQQQQQGYSFAGGDSTGRQLRSGGPNAQISVPTAPYGLMVSTSISPQNCPSTQGCFMNSGGGCQCGATSPYFLPSSSNIYY